MAALQYVHAPGYSAGIFRLSKPDMLKPEAILQRAHEWFTGTLARWDEELHSYCFPTPPDSDGRPQAEATIHFGFGRSLKEIRDRYQGAAFQFLGIDELTQWRPEPYLYLFSRLRRTTRLASLGVPLRFWSATNPGGTGHGFVKKRFIENARNVRGGTDVRKDISARKLGQAMPTPRIYVSPPSEEAVRVSRETGLPPQGCYFVPSFATDNQHLDQPTYLASLALLDPTTREQLRWGDWDAVEAGNWFKRTDIEVVETAPKLLWIRSWDFAATDPRLRKNKDPDWSVGARLGLEQLKEKDEKGLPRHRLWVSHIRRFQLEPAQTQVEVKGIAKTDGRRVPIVMEQEPGSAGKTVVHNWKTTLFGHSLHGFPKTGPKSSYWKPVSALSNNDQRGGGLVVVNGDWLEPLLNELESLPNGHDDQADAIAQGYSWLTGQGYTVARALMLSKL